MAKENNKNNGLPWTHDDITILKKLAEENKSSRFIGAKLGRSSSAVRSKASDLGISLKTK